MKFIHLSDLHIGKRVKEYSMYEDQKYILSEIVRIIDNENPDAVLIAGDVYDKSIPSTEAVELFDSFLFMLSKRNTKVFIISGNHDSAERLSFASRLIEKSGIYPPSSCRSGECGFCRSRLISGEVHIPEDMDKRRKADLKYGYIHPCCTFPLTDIEMEVFPK